MSTYLDLRSDIASWLSRSDIPVETLIRLANDDVNDDLRIRDMIRRARATGNDTRYLPLPDAFLEMRRLEAWPDSDRKYALVQTTPENLQTLNVRDTSASSYNKPQRYCIHREIEFDAPAGTDMEVEMVYYTPYPMFTADADTNFVLTNNYGIYLFGALRHAEPYLRNDERTPLWAASYAESVSKAMDTERRGRVNQAEMRVSLSSGMTP